MKIPSRFSLATLAAGLVATVVFNPVARVSAQVRPAQESAIANYDGRSAVASKPADAALQIQGEAHLKSLLPGVGVDYDGRLGTPKFIRASTGFLTGPNGQGGTVSAGAAQAIAANDPYRPVKAFLTEHTALFNFGAEALQSAVVTRESVTPHSGLQTVVWQQQLDNIPIFEAILIGNMTQTGELVTLSSQFLSGSAQSADAGTPNRQALQSNPTVSIQQAIIQAAQGLGDSLTPGGIVANAASNNSGYQAFAVSSGPARARLVWVPMNKYSLRLGWEVFISSQTMREGFQILVAADTGELLLRRNITKHISDATYNVYTSDSPSPFSPGWPTPNLSQPPLTSRTLVTIAALSVTASPNGWINDGNNSVIGNNAEAYLDRDDNYVPDSPQPQGNPSRVFNFPLDLTNAPTGYADASQVQLFYLLNWYHDRLYDLGFTESAGNYQDNNFGRGGIGNDHILGHVEDGAGLTPPQANNSFWIPAPDGFNGDEHMFIFTGTTPDRDGSLDAEVVFHETTHGTSERLVGGGALITALQTGGMGEGWSDFYADSLLSQAGDDPNGVYAVGGYITYQFVGFTLANYYYGIRHYPYCTDMSKNPFTFKDIDPTQISSHPGIPLSPLYSPFSSSEADEVHHQGEVWCVTLWEVRANLVAKYGYAGNQLVLQLVTDGMKLGPANPNFLQARDAIILADQVANGGANYSEIWRGFAKRGMGISATSPDSSTTIGLHESFDLPGLQIISTNLPGGNGNGGIDPNECNTLFIGLQNLAVTGATGIRATLTTTNANVIVTGKTSPYISLLTGASATNQTAFQFSTSPNFVCGTPVNFILTVKCDQFTQSNFFTLPSGSAGAPLRYDSVGTSPIPDLSSGDLPIVVTNFSGAVLKATLALYITHTFDSDLLLEVISPDGITNILASHVGGAGRNFGGNCTDQRTTFDDAATISIAAGTPPFIGTFKPENPLSVFIGKTGTNVNGTWHLHVLDTVAIDSGAIQCWSLFLSTPACTDGGGECPGSDLAIGGSAAPEPLIIGGNLTYNLSITNLGPKTAKGVSLTQTLPASVVFISANISQGSISASGNTVNGNFGNVPVGAVVTAAISVLPTQAGTLTSTATASAVSDPDPDTSNNSVTLTSHVNPPTSDLAIGLTGAPDPVLVGGTLTYTISATNKGPSTATSVVVSNILAASVAVTSATPSQGSATILGNVVVFNLGTLSPGAVATATITVIPSTLGQITATSTIRANQLDPVSANNTASVTTAVSPAADLAVGFVSVPASIVLGNNLNYTVSATNLGPSTASSVFITQTLPPNAIVNSFSSSAGTVSQVGNLITCDVGSMSLGAVVTMSVQVLIPSAGTVTCSVNISGGLTDPVPANNSATVNTIVALPFVNIQPSGATLTSESIAPANGSVEPGETVTVQFRLVNLGNVSTTNLMAKLLATGGVTAPSATTQVYGPLAAGGLPVSKSFSFTASGTNGGSIIATLQLSGDVSNSVSFTFQLPKIATFANTNVIVIPDVGKAAPYPSTITVAGVTGVVGRVTATLANFNHTYPNDVSVLLVSPSGAKSLLMSHTANFGSAVVGGNFTFDDSAPGPLPDTGSIASGNWQPSAYPPAPVFTNPAPAGPYTAALSVFNSANPNGTWSLFVIDEVTGDRGGISNGWSLAITTINPVNQTADLALTGAGVPNPVLAGGNLTYTFTVINNGTNSANGVAFTNTLPAGVLYVSAAASQGSVSTNAGRVVGSLGSLAVGASASVTIVVSPTNSGVLSSTATVSASETDLVPANNSATVSTTVNLPVADVSISKSVSANTVVAGSNFVYTLSVTNNGPGTALNVVVSDPLPAGVTFVSASAGTFAGGTLTCNLGNLAAGASTLITVTAQAVAVSTITNTATVATGSTDGNSTNNSSSVSTVIRAPSAKISAVSAKLLSESFTPKNGAVDPGEIISVSLTLTNSGEIDTASLVATLANTGGVTASSGSTNYGALVHNGAAVSRNFSFTASSAASGVVTATLSLQDGANNLGTVVFTFVLPQTNSFANTNAIIIPDHGNAAPYPSTISVGGLTGLVSKVVVTLNGVTHAFPRDIGILLVSPAGAKSVVMSGAGAGNSITNVTLTFDDAAAAALSDTAPIISGTSKPTAYPSARTFPAPAPAGTATALFSQLNGGDPNGVWSLYVVDDVTGDAGIISGGWSLALTTVSTVNPTADLTLSASASPNSVYVGHNVTYTLLVTNKGPSTATGVVITNTLPVSVGLGAVTLSQGTYTTNVTSVFCNLGSLSVGQGAMVTITVIPSLAGPATDTALAVANETDLNALDNSASASIAVLTIIPARLSGVLTKTNHQFQFTLTGQPNLSYIILASTNLTSSSAWKPISTNTAASNGTFQFTDTNAPGLPQRFYRTMVAP